MRRRLIAWILIILAALVLYLFSNESVTLALLIAVTAAVPVSFLLLRATYKKLEVSIKDSEKADGSYGFILSIKNKGILPLAAVETELRCVNLRTGETDIYSVSRGTASRKSRDIEMEIVPSHAGRYELSLGPVYVTDPLGIWRRELSCEDKKTLTVLPSLYEMHVSASSSAAMPESDYYSSSTKGSVAGDMIGIKEYVAGDPVRNIHWKLSEKTDRMLVKELGNPIMDEFLLILDNAPDIAQDPAALDAVASVYASLIHDLLQKDAVVSASWSDPATGRAVIRRLTGEEDARAAAEEYLAVPAAMPSAFKKIERDIADNRYAHVVIVGSRIPDGIDNISNGCQVTVLMHGGGRSFTEKNMTVVGFETSSYIFDTVGVEV